MRHRVLIGAFTLRWRRRGCDCGIDSKSSSGYGSIRESRSRFGVERQGSNAVLSLVGLPVSPVALKNSMESSCTDGLNKRKMPMSIGSETSTLSKCMAFRFGRMGLSPKMNEILHQNVSRRSAAWWEHHNSPMHGSTTIFWTRDAYSRNRPHAESCASGVPQSSYYSRKRRKIPQKVRVAYQTGANAPILGRVFQSCESDDAKQVLQRTVIRKRPPQSRQGRLRERGVGCR